VVDDVDPMMSPAFTIRVVSTGRRARRRVAGRDGCGNSTIAAAAADAASRKTSRGCTTVDVERADSRRYGRESRCLVVEHDDAELLDIGRR
jgi:hypothetical protein